MALSEHQLDSVREGYELHYESGESRGVASTDVDAFAQRAGEVGERADAAPARAGTPRARDRG